jgi:hypothetical protein
MDEDRAGGPERVRLPGHDERSGYRPAYPWPRDDFGPPGGYWPGYARDGGIRSSRRASTWTAAALIAGVAATTGYLAHAIPAAGTSSGTGKGSAPKAPKAHSKTVVRAPSAPAVRAPVVTSGGSGAAGGGGGGD